MGYVLSHDIHIVKQKKRYFLGYLGVLLIITICSKMMMLTDFDSGQIYINMGWYITSLEDYTALLLFLFSTSFFLYIGYFLFTSDLKNGMDNLFLRISSKKWIGYKLLSIFFILVILKSMIFLLALILSIIFAAFSLDIFFVFLIDIVFTYTVILLGCFLYSLFLKSRFMSLLGLGGIVLLYFLSPFLFSSYGFLLHAPYIVLLLVFLLIVTIIYILLFPRLFVKVFERVQ